MDIAKIQSMLLDLKGEVDPNKTLTDKDVERIRTKMEELERLVD